jgi:CPA1 family monovalent cation:H+ antiporter
VLPAAYVPRWASPGLRARDASPPWTDPVFIALAGVRGVVSLAAALSIPYAIMSGPGRAFPDRSLILFLTFSVILVTLVWAALVLPIVVRRLGLAERGSWERRDRDAREIATHVAAARYLLRELKNIAADKGLSPKVADEIRVRMMERIAHLRRRTGEGADRVLAEERERGELALVVAERGYLNRLLYEHAIDDEVRRRIERDLDLREERLRRNVQGVTDDD